MYNCITCKFKFVSDKKVPCTTCLNIRSHPYSLYEPDRKEKKDGNNKRRMVR